MSRGHRLPPSKWNKNKGGDEEKGGGIAYKQTNKEGCRERERERQTEMTAKSSTRQSSLCSSPPDIFLIFNQKKRENVVGVITIMLSSHLLQFNFPSISVGNVEHTQRRRWLQRWWWWQMGYNGYTLWTNFDHYRHLGCTTSTTDQYAGTVVPPVRFTVVALWVWIIKGTLQRFHRWVKI